MKNFILFILFIVSLEVTAQQPATLFVVADTNANFTRPLPSMSFVLSSQTYELFVLTAPANVSNSFRTAQKQKVSSSSNAILSELDPRWTADKPNYVTTSYLTSQNYLQSFTELDPLWTADKPNYVTTSYLTSQNYLQSFTELDPRWTADKPNYVTTSYLTSQNYLQSFTELDPLWTADKPNYVDKTQLADSVTLLRNEIGVRKMDTLITQIDGYPANVYSFILQPNTELLVDSFEMTKTAIFSLQTIADSELVIDYQYNFNKLTTEIIRNLMGTRVCNTTSNVILYAQNNKIYLKAIAAQNQLNFNIKLLKKLII